MSNMKIGEIKVIDERFVAASPAASWDEYLVLEKLSDTEFLLDIRGWGYLGEVGVGEFDFEEDEYGDWVVPEEVNGQHIESVEDGFVYGGNLVKREDEQGEIKFIRPDQDEVVSWLKSVKWDDIDVTKVLAREFSK